MHAHARQRVASAGAAHARSHPGYFAARVCCFFALQMLKETLDKMSEKIEITNQGWEDGAGNDISRRLQEHKLGVGGP